VVQVLLAGAGGARETRSRFSMMRHQSTAKRCGARSRGIGCYPACAAAFYQEPRI